MCFLYHFYTHTHIHTPLKFLTQIPLTAIFLKDLPFLNPECLVFICQISQEYTIYIYPKKKPWEVYAPLKVNPNTQNSHILEPACLASLCQISKVVYLSLHINK